MRELHRKRDFAGIVKLIRNTMNINVRLVLHWTDEIRGSAPAWVMLPPDKLPYYGTPEFKKTKIDMYIRRSFANSEPYDRFAIAVAHEFSHVILNSIHHPLRHEEKAVDLTAMILGFCHLYQQAADRVEWIGLNKFERRTLGYLSESELAAACQILVPTKLRVKQKASKALRHAEDRATNVLLRLAIFFIVLLGVVVVAGACDYLISLIR
jgi:hypothetical protein